MEIKRLSFDVETETQWKLNAIVMETQRNAKNAWCGKNAIIEILETKRIGMVIYTCGTVSTVQGHLIIYRNAPTVSFYKNEIQTQQQRNGSGAVNAFN
jgi:hypothetical protein